MGFLTNKVCKSREPLSFLKSVAAEYISVPVPRTHGDGEFGLFFALCMTIGENFVFLQEKISN